MPMIFGLAAFLAGYLLGSLNTSVIVGKCYGKNITEQGSQNAGLTNTLRVLGKKAAAFVLLGDIAKGIAACLIGIAIDSRIGPPVSTYSLGMLSAGAGAIVGHNWPIYFGFKGGKGALTAATVMFMFDWTASLTCLGVFVAVVAITRYVSLATMVATLCFVALSFLPFTHQTGYFQAFSTVIAGIIIFKHRSNIRRLLEGRESKLSAATAPRQRGLE